MTIFCILLFFIYMVKKYKTWLKFCMLFSVATAIVHYFALLNAVHRSRFKVLDTIK